MYQEIQIITEAAGNGSIHSLILDMPTHDNSIEGCSDLHLPLSYVADLFKFHYMPGWKVSTENLQAIYVSFIVPLYYFNFPTSSFL
jgi:hypothetical protein